jgi:hypothetical protein
MAVSMVVFSALAVVGVDLARLTFTANEVQTLADVAATAGVRALVDGQSVLAAAQNAAAQNRVDAAAGAIAPPGTVVVGTYDPSSGIFTAGGNTPNAVRANAEKTVNNFVGAILSTPTTLVQKTSTAAYMTTGSGMPTIPLAIDDCQFQAGCQTQSCLPNVITVPSTQDNSGWTGLTADNSSQTTVLGYFPAPCGTGGAVPSVDVGTNISLGNGDVTPLFNAVQCMLCNPNIQPKQWLIPVVHQCTAGNFNQTEPVIGFATIEIDHFITSNGTSKTCENGGGAIKQIVLRTIFRSDVPGGPPGGSVSCTGCGTGYITMVN